MSVFADTRQCPGLQNYSRTCRSCREIRRRTLVRFLKSPCKIKTVPRRRNDRQITAKPIPT